MFMEDLMFMDQCCTQPVTIEIEGQSINVYSKDSKQSLQLSLKIQFSLLFQILKKNNQPVFIHDQENFPHGKPYALLFEKNNQNNYTYYSNNPQTLIKWKNVLITKLNMKGFHQNFQPIKKIGKGNFASVFIINQVYLSEEIQTKKRYAVKAFSKEKLYAEAKGKINLINQIKLMRKINHHNIMKFYGVYQSKNSIYIIAQLITGGQLQAKISNKHKFTQKQTKIIIKGLISAVMYLHSIRIMHRDIKPQNILMRDGQPVLCDFGLATDIDQKKFIYSRCGTPGYVAPEIINLKDLTKKYGPVCDVFSIGVIFHILQLNIISLLKKSVFPGKDYKEVLAQNRACNFQIIGHQYQKITKAAIDLLKKMLIVFPLTRITAKQAYNHQYFQFNEQMVIQTPQIGNIQRICSANNKSPLMTSSNYNRRKKEKIQDSIGELQMKTPLFTGNTKTVYSSIDSPGLEININKKSNIYFFFKKSDQIQQQQSHIQTKNIKILKNWV